MALIMSFSATLLGASQADDQLARLFPRKDLDVIMVSVARRYKAQQCPFLLLMIVRILSGLTLRDSGMETEEHDQAVFFSTEFGSCPLRQSLEQACGGKKGTPRSRCESSDELARGELIGGVSYDAQMHPLPDPAPTVEIQQYIYPNQERDSCRSLSYDFCE